MISVALEVESSSSSSSAANRVVSITDFNMLNTLEADDASLFPSKKPTSMLCTIGSDESLGLFGQKSCGKKMVFADANVRVREAGKCLAPVSVFGNPEIHEDRIRSVTIALTEAMRSARSSYMFPPSLLDSAMQAADDLLAKLHAQSGSYSPRTVDSQPCSIAAITVSTQASDSMWSSDSCTARVAVRIADRDSVLFDCCLLTAEGEVVLTLTGVSVVRGACEDWDALPGFTDPCIELRSEWVQAPLIASASPSGQGAVNSCLLVRYGGQRAGATDSQLLSSLRGNLSFGDCESVYVDSMTELVSSRGSYDSVVCLIDTSSSLGGAEDWIHSSGVYVKGFLCVLQAVAKLTSKLLVTLDAGDTTKDSGASEIIYGTISGAVLCCEQEYSNLSTSIVNIRQKCSPQELSQLISCELSAFSSCPLEITYQENQRLARKYVESHLPPAVRDIDCQKIAGSYIITGGLGGLGLLTAKLLARLGATHVFLVSRSGRVAHEGQGLEADLQWLQSSECGAQVHVLRCDVSDESAVVRMLSEVRATAGGVDGVVHCAGVLRDALIRGGGAAAGCADVWNSKALSAWWLHKHTLQDDLRVFLCYSSITAALGNIGQSAYGAANRFLDSLVSERRGQGLCGVSIRWPAISGVGMAAGNEHLVTLDETNSMDAGTAVRLLTKTFSGVSDVNTITLLPSSILSLCHSSPIKSQFDLLKMNPTAAPVAVKLSRVASKFTKSQVHEAVSRIATSLSEGNYALTDDSQLMDCGLDSLGIIDLASQLSSEFDLQLPQTFVFDFPNIGLIVAQINELLGLSDKADVTVPFSSFNSSGDMAIVGVSCRLPGDVGDLSALWSVLSQGRDVTGQAPLHRWDTDAIVSSGGDSKNEKVLDRVRYGGFLSDEVLESFRASLFGISDAEASRMDPGQRLLLETSHDALLDAGYTKATVSGKRVGVFVGASGSLGEESVGNCGVTIKNNLSVYDATGKTLSVAAGRISYSLGLQGPCSTTDTACSSSLVALHAARRSLQHNECASVVVVGVNVLSATTSVGCAIAGMTSPDGKCHTFDASANGYCRGEGCGAIVMK
eukprot:gene31056-38385_t